MTLGTTGPAAVPDGWPSLERLLTEVVRLPTAPRTPQLWSGSQALYRLLSDGSEATAREAGLPPSLVAALAAAPDLIALLGAGGRLERCARAALPRRNNADPSAPATTLLRSFADVGVAARLLAMTVFAAYDQRVLTHLSHARGECPCVALRDRAPFVLSRDIVLRAWAAAVLVPAQGALRAQILALVQAEWAGDAADPGLLSNVVRMAGQCGTGGWLSDVVLEAYVAHVSPLSQRLASASEQALPGLLTAASKTIAGQLAQARRWAPWHLHASLAKAAASVVVAPNLELLHGRVASLIGGAQWDAMAGLTALEELRWAGRPPDGLLQAAVEAALTSLLQQSLRSARNSGPFGGAAFVDVVEGWALVADKAVAHCPLRPGFSRIRHVALGAALAEETELTGVLSEAVSAAAAQGDDDGKWATIADCLHHVRERDDFAERVLRRCETRLLPSALDLSGAADREAPVVRLLQRHSFFEAARQLQARLADVQASADFRSASSTRGVSVLVCRPSCWETVTGGVCPVPPPALLGLQVGFEAEYRRAFPHRHLTWLHRHSVVVLRTLYTPQRAELTVPFHFAVVLLLLDRVAAITDDDVAAALGGTPHPHRVVEHLLKSRALKTVPAVASPVRTLELGRDVVARGRRQRSLLPRATPEAAGDATTQQQRRPYVEMAIIKTMKSRRRVPHGDLCSSVVLLLRDRFVPSVALVKHAIGDLLAREYIAREPDDPQTYVYLP